MNKEMELRDFERIVILKTIIYDVDENYLDTDDLLKIKDVANRLEIIELTNLGFYDLDNNPYNLNEKQVRYIFNTWREIIYKEYLKIFDKLLNMME